MGVIAVISGSLISPIEVCGQTSQYTVTELSSDDATRVPCKLNNHGDIAGRADNALHGEPRATLWNRSNLHSKHLVLSSAATIVQLSISMIREKSLGHRVPAAQLYPLSGMQEAA